VVYEGESGDAVLGRDEGFASGSRGFLQMVDVRWLSTLEGAYEGENEGVESRGTGYGVSWYVFPPALLPIVTDPEICRGSTVPLLVAGLVVLGLSMLFLSQLTSSHQDL